MTYTERILKFAQFDHMKGTHWNEDRILPILKAIMESNEKLVEKIRMSISRSDDYGDSHCSQPIRQALKDHAADMEKILE
jgi:hypothetical protein